MCEDEGDNGTDRIRSRKTIHTIQSLLMVTPVALEGWHVKKTDERTQKTQYLLWIYYFIYPIFLLCLARA